MLIVPFRAKVNKRNLEVGLYSSVLTIGILGVPGIVMQFVYLYFMKAKMMQVIMVFLIYSRKLSPNMENSKFWL